MVGGHAVKVSDEMVFRFEFPERPGALFNFLTKLGGRWNISMFPTATMARPTAGWWPGCRCRKTSAT